MSEINCEFSMPVDIGTPEFPDFEYSILNCTSTGTSTVQQAGTVQISDGENSFFLNPVVTYSEVIIICFFIIILAGSIFKFIWDFVHLLIIKWRKL